jgi:hypothetical protein
MMKTKGSKSNTNKILVRNGGQIENFWLMLLTVIHKYLATLVNKLIKEDQISVANSR